MEGNSTIPCLVKIVLLGNASAGKSSLMQAYTKSSLADPAQLYVPTRGVEFCNGTSELLGKRIKFQIWDTAGDQRYRAPTPKYCTNAAGCACVYDRSDRESFEACVDWLQQARDSCAPAVALALVGTKSDLIGDHSVLDEVSSSEGRQLAKQQAVRYYETSAVCDLEGIQLFFGQFIALALRNKTQPALERAAADSSMYYPEESMTASHAVSDIREDCEHESEARQGTQSDLVSHDAMLQFVDDLVVNRAVAESKCESLRRQLDLLKEEQYIDPRRSTPLGTEPAAHESQPVSNDEPESCERLIMAPSEPSAFMPYQPLNGSNLVVTQEPVAGRVELVCLTCGWGSPTQAEVVNAALRLMSCTACLALQDCLLNRFVSVAVISPAYTLRKALSCSRAAVERAGALVVALGTYEALHALQLAAVVDGSGQVSRHSRKCSTRC